jgi:hypothetical protein
MLKHSLTVTVPTGVICAEGCIASKEEDEINIFVYKEKKN